MYAIIKTGGKQYRVAPEDIITVEKLPGEAGDQVVISDVLMVDAGSGVEVGAPFVEGASVACELVEQKRGRKIIIFKKKRRKHYRRKKGHRQHYTVLRVMEILTGGASPKAAAKAGKAAPKKAAPKKGAPAKAEKKAAEKKAAPGKAAGKKEEAAAGADDLSLLSGVGPVLVKKLAEAGYTTFRQIAELTEEAIDALDKELNLRGRIRREEWVEQARELMAGKAPRAKVDQKAAAKAKNKK